MVLASKPLAYYADYVEKLIPFLESLRSEWEVIAENELQAASQSQETAADASSSSEEKEVSPSLPVEKGELSSSSSSEVRIYRIQC